jgi:hypothetical protein
MSLYTVAADTKWLETLGLLRKEVSNMEKILVILAAVFMVFGFSVVGSAHNLNVVGAGYQTGRMGSQLTCGPGEMYVGEVAWVYPNTQSIMVSGRDGSKIFDVSKATMKGLPEADQFVTVKYAVVDGDRIASSVTAVPRQVASLYVGDF